MRALTLVLMAAAGAALAVGGGTRAAKALRAERPAVRQQAPPRQPGPPRQPQTQSNGSVGWYAQLSHISEQRAPSTYDAQGKLVSVGARLPGTGAPLLFPCTPAVFDYFPGGAVTVNFTCLMSHGGAGAAWFAGPFPDQASARAALAQAMAARSPKEWFYPNDMPP